MRAIERTTDILVSNMMTQVGLKPQPQGSMIPEVHQALRNASKRKTGKPEKPDPFRLLQNPEFSLLRIKRTNGIKQTICQRSKTPC